MLRDAFILHDGFLNTVNQTSSDAFSPRIAASDAAAFFIVVENVEGQTGSITVQLEHSGDAVTWVKKSGTAEINAVALSTTGDTVVVGYDNGTMPTMHHGRLRMTSTVAKPEKLYVCAYVALRDVDPPEVIKRPAARTSDDTFTPEQKAARQQARENQGQAKNSPEAPAGQGSSKAHPADNV